MHSIDVNAMRDRSCESYRHNILAYESFITRKLSDLQYLIPHSVHVFLYNYSMYQQKIFNESCLEVWLTIGAQVSYTWLEYYVAITKAAVCVNLFPFAHSAANLLLALV